MSVKSIFKTLLGTAVIIVASFMLIELFNVCIVSYQLQGLSKLSAHQACTLFTQETYKIYTGTDGGAGGAINIDTIYSPDGTEYISGEFYTGSTKEEIWRNLYADSTEFRSFCNTYKDKFTNLRLLYNGIDKSGNVPVPTVDWNSTNSVIQQNIDATKANNYYKNIYTAANLGLPYMDKSTVEKMFKWNLAKMYSNCDEDNIRVDENGNTYVYFKGYRCYVQDAKIHNITYKTFDLSNDSTRATVADELKSYTGLTVKGITALDNGGITWKVDKDLVGNDIYDNAIVMTVEIDYYVPIAYEGITPLKTLFSWVWGNEVEGLNNDGIDNTTGSEISDINYAGVLDKNDKNATVQIMNSEDYKNGSGTVPSTGKLVFTLVK